MLRQTISIAVMLVVLIITAACEKVIVDTDISATPVNPQPVDGVAGIPIMTELSWEIKGDLVDYNFDVYFGETNPPPLVKEDHNGTIYNVGHLLYDTAYYWQIVTRDRYGGVVEGPIWSFTTFNGYLIDEGFEGVFPPEGWTADPEWTQSNDAYTGNYSAECYLESHGDGMVSAELITPWLDKGLITYNKAYLSHALKYDSEGAGGFYFAIYVEGGGESVNATVSSGKNGWEINYWDFPPPYEWDYFRLKFVCTINSGVTGDFNHIWLDDIRLTDFMQLPG